MVNTLYYFYEVRNKINNYYYYGVHKTKNLDDGYMGSGTRLHYAFNKYGIENFEKTILQYFDSMIEAYQYESIVVTETLVKDSECYNSKIGGKGGWPDRTGQATVKDKNDNNFLVSTSDKRLKNGELVGCTKGRIVVKDNKENMYSVSIDDKRYTTRLLKPLWQNRKHTKETKDKIGLTNSIKQKGKNNSQFGTCWICNKKSVKKISKNDLNEWISKGWQRGRKFR